MALDGEADDLLTPVEQLKSVFDLCDKDSDGLLTVSEFRTLTHQFLGAATEQVEKLIKELDPQESGVIDFENFRKGIESFLLARRDSSSSSLSGSCLSLNGFGDDPLLTSSPTDRGGNSDTVHDIHYTYTDADTKRSLSYQFNNNNGSEIEELDMMDAVTSDHSITERQDESKSLSTLEVQPSGISPSLMARTLARKGSSHSYLQVSGGGTATTGSSHSYDSTPDWTIDEDHDELTDKLLELSTRLEGLEVDLDSSQAQTLHLRRENHSLRDRIETYEERLREFQIEKETIEKNAAESLRQTKMQLKRKFEEEMDELRTELVEAQDNIKQLEASNAILRSSLEEANQHCDQRREESMGLRVRINELEDEVHQTKEIFKLEKIRLDKEHQGSQQELEAMGHVIEHLRRELEDGKVSKKRNAVTTSDIRNGEIAILKKEIKSLQEANDRLSSQLLQHGKQLMAEQPKSLLEELEDAPRNEIVKALKEQEEYNERLKAYIEGLLVTIIEKHPELLEVKM